MHLLRDSRSRTTFFSYSLRYLRQTFPRVRDRILAPPSLYSLIHVRGDNAPRVYTSGVKVGAPCSVVYRTILLDTQCAQGATLPVEIRWDRQRISRKSGKTEARPREESHEDKPFPSSWRFTEICGSFSKGFSYSSEWPRRFLLVGPFNGAFAHFSPAILSFSLCYCSLKFNRDDSHTLATKVAECGIRHD